MSLSFKVHEIDVSYEHFKALVESDCNYCAIGYDSNFRMNDLLICNELNDEGKRSGLKCTRRIMKIYPALLNLNKARILLLKLDKY